MFVLWENYYNIEDDDLEYETTERRQFVVVLSIYDLLNDHIDLLAMIGIWVFSYFSLFLITIRVLVMIIVCLELYP